ncbi:cytochrome P450 4g15 [Tribolium castaneum]|uniref:Cytochrome P450-like protein n=1 Tax=Tribolium castaneum TaxID=7070 RepID=D6WD10_TRICA|nr:PREDICTED: cytochrome P450 4g15 [Tribolium castaneum]EEZ99364.1 cytochrome P450-like protein [Tribolium castaneum]|eukprot:XP_015838382.1 PREDICTED: cytochrome P450 4g15 [Tribolium castaneum]
MLFLLLVILIICCLVKYHWDRRKLYLFAAKLQGPKAYPVVGNGPLFWCKNEEIFNNFMAATAPYPSPVRLWVGPKLVLFVKDPNQLQLILQSSKITTKSFLYRFLEPFLGKGLFTSSGPRQKHHRKLLQPLFSQRMIEGYCHLFQKHSKKFVEDLRKNANGPEFNISTFLQFTAFEATMDLLLEDQDTHSIDYNEIPNYVRKFYEIVFTRVKSFWLHLDIFFKLSSYYREQTKLQSLATTVINEITETNVPKIIEKIKAERKLADAEIRVPSMLESIAEMVMENPDCLTMQDCTDHLMTFMATSQDTQSSAVAFTCMMLGAYPHIQDLVVQELREVMGKKTSLDLTDVSQLKYLEMCLKESMRLFPVGPFIFRDTTEDFQFDKMVIPEGVTVILSIYHAHRSPEHWEKPDEFYPEHFAPEAMSKRHPCAFIPFSAGPRRCIAQHYSYTYMKILLATIVLNYEIECRFKAEDVKLIADISIRPQQGYLIKLKDRTN